MKTLQHFFRATTMRLLAAGLGLLIVGVCSTTVSADDWPRWMGAQYDGVWRESGMIDEFPESGPNVLWRQKIGPGYSGPSISAGRVFAMERTKDQGIGLKVENKVPGEMPGGERIRCLDLTSGQEIWSHTYDCPYKIAYPTGPRCTPTVDGSHIYTLGAMGHLKCLSAANGDVVWEKNLTEEYETKPPLWGYASHPFIDGENLIVPVGGKGTALVAFEKTTGKEIWRAVTTNDIGYAPVVIYQPDDADGERQLIFWHGKGVTGLSPDDGAEYWNVKFPEEANQSIVTIATPVLVGNKLLIAEFYKGALLLEVGSNPPSVNEVWRNFKKNPKLDDALNAMMATPVVMDGLAYGIAYNKRGQGVMRCIELDNGNMTWTDEKWMGEKPLMFANGFITPNGDKQFIFNDIGELVIARLSREGYQELDRAKILEPTSVARGRDVVWSHPAYSDGKMIVRNDEEVVCVDLKK